MSDLLDRVYDTLTQGAAIIGTALGVDMSDVMPPKSPTASGAPFRIEEVIDGDSGRVAFVVTDGRGASCDAPTRALTEATLDTLEARGCVVVRDKTETVKMARQGSASPAAQHRRRAMRR